MSFIWPAMLGSLLLLAPLVALYLRTQGRRRALAARYGGFGLAQTAGAGPGPRRYIPPALSLIALLLLGVALARPQAIVSLPRLEGTLVLVVDVSASMAADDVEPTRLEAARAVARELVRRQPATALVGVVAFSDGGLAVQAPTRDQPAILAAIERLSPQRGTSVGEGIMAALNSIAAAGGEGPAGTADGPTPTPLPRGTYAPAAIVLLSDGENNAQPDPLAAAQAAAERGVRIYTVGVGSAAGTTLQLDGFSVHSRLEEEALRQIAQLTGGAYYGPQDSAGLRGIYDEVAARLVARPEATEVTALFVGAGLLLLLAGGLCSFLWFNRLA
ncbi:MAG: VWA domain-containing protein [Chloroflexales bacterium]|nr:VWA domain-containing protein [Chloroflexales bacterium]